jgi:hypothetical protein
MTEGFAMASKPFDLALKNGVVIEAGNAGISLLS